MAEKLRSILKRAHWSLITRAHLENWRPIFELGSRAVIFAAAWLFLPWWLFLFVALGSYFYHFFQPWKTFAAFLCLVALTAAQSPSLLFALIFGAVFYYLLLIKDLMIIDRRSAYDILVLALSFFLIRDFFRGFYAPGAAAFFWSFWIAVAIGLLADSMMRFFAVDNFSSASLSVSARDAVLDGDQEPVSGENMDSDVFNDHLRRPREVKDPRFQYSSLRYSPEARIPRNRLRPVAAWLIALLSWQLLLVGLFLPLDFIYQSVIVFVAAAFLYELITGYFFNDLSREKTFVTVGVFFSIIILLLASATWKP